MNDDVEFVDRLIKAGADTRLRDKVDILFHSLFPSYKYLYQMMNEVIN